jgi:TATA-binding protein-associated factor
LVIFFSKVSHDCSYIVMLLCYRQLLLDCGIGLPPSSDQAETVVVNQHRALIFCQLKAMLDIVEKDLLRSVSPQLSRGGRNDEIT